MSGGWIFLIVVVVLIVALKLSLMRSAKKLYERTTKCDRCRKEFDSEDDKHLNKTGGIYCTECLEIVKKSVQTQTRTQIQRKSTPKEPEPVRCPKCRSQDLTAGGKKLSIGRGLAGSALFGPVGAIVGATTSKKVKITCLNCGNSWTAGKK